MTAVEFEHSGHVAVVTINRPEARNAVNPEVLVRLAEAWQRVHDDDAIRIAVLTGAGESAFCSGADLKLLIPLMTGAREPETEWDRAYVADPTLSGRALLRDFDVGKPVIAAVNGFAIAGGFELMLGTDLRVAADGARLGLQEAKWGLFPLGGATVRLPRAIPQAIAMEILLTGDLIDARRAHDLGLVNQVVPQEEVMDAALFYAETIAANGPLAVQAIRTSARASSGVTEAVALQRELELGTPVFQTRDAREGPRAFAEKRAPRFEGR